jgi:hypothetical protein
MLGLALAMLAWVAVVVQCGSVSPVAAQQSPSHWTTPVNLSDCVAPCDGPKIAADRAGDVHVVWVEYASRLDGRATDAVIYASKVSGVWSDPIDILTQPTGSTLVTDDLDVDAHDRLVAVWHSDTSIHVSTCAAGAGHSAVAWRTTTIDIAPGVNGAQLHIDPSGDYHLAYVRENRTVLYTASADGGATWADPIEVSRVGRSDQAVQLPAIVATGDSICVAWELAVEGTGWGPATWSAGGVWLACSTDQGRTWSAPVEMAGAGYGAPTLFADSTGLLYLGWIGNIAAGGRYYVTSRDGGLSWGRPVTIASPEQYSGHSGAMQFLTDSTGKLHVVFSAGYQGVGKIWYSALDDDEWASPRCISEGLPRSERESAAIATGQTIHAVWYEYASGDVWYSAFDTGAVPVLQTPVPLPVTEGGGHTPTPEAQGGGGGVSAGTPATELRRLSAERPRVAGNRLAPVVLATLPVLALLGATLAVLRLPRRRE